MIKNILNSAILVVLFSAFCSGDTFTNISTGETFYGYPTQKSRGNRTRIYVLEDEKLIGKTVDISEYNITYGAKGRKNNVVVVPLNNENILISSTVSKLVSRTIEEAVNKGARYVILEIDCPGGYGDYMKDICQTITNIEYCPVIAFIKGEKYGGAYSAAAGVALACDKIYISPEAAIGTVGPKLSGQDPEESSEWKVEFTPESIASYGGYLASLAGKNSRPEAMAMALVDRNIEIVEVVTDERGSRDIIHKAEKRPADAIVRTWSKIQKKVVKTESDEYAEDSSSAEVITRTQITLTPKDALYTKMADEIASSRDDVLKALEAEDAKVVATRRIRSEIKKFRRARDSMVKLFANINELDNQAANIENQIEKVVEAGLRHRPSPEDERLKRLERKEYEQRLRKYRKKARRNRHLTKEELAELEMESRDIYVDPYILERNRLYHELVLVLNNLINHYTQVVKLARNYPASLPGDTNLTVVQQELTQLHSKRNAIGL